MTRGISLPDYSGWRGNGDSVRSSPQKNGSSCFVVIASELPSRLWATKEASAKSCRAHKVYRLGVLYYRWSRTAQSGVTNWCKRSYQTLRLLPSCGVWLREQWRVISSQPSDWTQLLTVISDQSTVEVDSYCPTLTGEIKETRPQFIEHSPQCLREFIYYCL